MEPGLAGESRKEVARLRSFMAEPGSAYIVRSDKRIWLCDGFVLADVTDSAAVVGVDDGWYRLVMTKGFVNRGGAVAFNLPLYFTRARRFHYYPAYPTVFSITDSDAKAMIVYVEIPYRPESHRDHEPPVTTRYPLAMNQDIWRAFHAAYPDAILSHPGYDGPFRISAPGNLELAYVEPIRIPERLQKAARALVEASETEESE